MLRLCLFAVWVFTSIIWCDSIEEGWKGILPLRSDREFVEAKLGKPTSTKGEISEYLLNDAFVRITYSREGCSGKVKGRIYNIPDDTVLEYTVNYRSKVDVAGLNFDRATFYKDTSGDVVNNYSLVKFNAGVLIGVETINERDLVSNIWYWPSKTDSERFRCAQE